jgi:hypothetical protein
MAKPRPFDRENASYRVPTDWVPITAQTIASAETRVLRANSATVYNWRAAEADQETLPGAGR